jgi:hypothetical protein
MSATTKGMPHQEKVILVLNVVVHACNFSYGGGRDRRITFQGQHSGGRIKRIASLRLPWAISKTLSQKQTNKQTTPRGKIEKPVFFVTKFSVVLKRQRHKVIILH